MIDVKPRAIVLGRFSGLIIHVEMVPESERLMNESTFVAQSNYAMLTTAVIDQCGGWESFEEDAENIQTCGAAGGFGGFIYYTETCKFYDDNKALILSAFAYECHEMGMGAAECLHNFNCVTDCRLDVCERFLMGLDAGDEETQLKNAMSWWALERVSADYVYALEG